MGALRHFAQGGAADGDDDNGYDDPDYDETYGGAASYDENPQGGALASRAPDEEIDRYSALGHALAGSPEEIAGALSRQRQSVDEGYAKKQAALGRAMTILRASGQGQTNLPLMVAGANLMGPSWNFGQSVSNAANAAEPVIRQQRQEDLQRALDLGKLDVEGSDLDIQRAKENQSDWAKQQDLGERYLRYAASLRQRNQVAEEQQAYRDSIAAERKRTNDLREEANAQGKYTWQPGNGPDPDDPDKQVPGSWRFPSKGDEEPKFFAGKVQTGRGGARGTGTSATQWKYDTYVQNHQDDIDKGIKTKEQVQQEALDLATGKRAMTPQQALSEGYKVARAELANHFPPATPTEIDSRAHEVAQQFLPSQHPTLPGINSPLPPAASPNWNNPGGRPAAPSPLQLPEPLRKIPPAQIEWSASRQQYRDKKTGIVYDAKGKKVS